MKAIQYATRTKSRKDRTCDLCFGKINTGDHYMRSVWKYEGSIYPVCNHECCQWLTNELNMYEDGEGLSPDAFQEYIHNRFVEISMQSECLINAPTFKEKLTIVYNYHKNQTAPSGDGGENKYD